LSIKIISIGRLEEAKGYPILLKSIRILKKTFPDILLTIVGDGSQKKILQNYIKNNRLVNNVKLTGFMGHTPQLIRLMQTHDYFVLPSITDFRKVHDVHPNVVKEAMSCGLITITSNLGGIKEIIIDKSNGFLVNKITPYNLTEIIKTVHSLSSLEKIKISAAARLTILKNHQQKNVCFQLKQISIRYIQ
jgi:colanic acid/amylovoran biosynthesis glycosyltransferase